MTPIDKMFMAVGITLCAVAVIFAIAAVVFDDFRADGTLIAGTILASLTTMASIIIGINTAVRRENGANKDNGANK